MGKRRTSQRKVKRLLRFLILFALVCIAICIALIVKTVIDKNHNGKAEDGKTKEIESVVNEVEVPNDITINLAVIGDIMCHNTQYMDAFVDGVYDFDYVFDDIREKLQVADYTVGNLETTFAGAGRGYSSYPEFNTPEELGIAIKNAGIDLVSTANNHSLDSRYAGVESTIDFLNEYGIAHTGTYKSQEEQDTPTIVDIQGLKVAFLSFTYGTNGIPVADGKEYCINLIDDDFIVDRLNLTKAQNPDVICVFMHWGEEYQTSPNAEQKHLAELLFDNGVNVILGSHPHVLQRMEKVDLGTELEPKEGFVIYSLGNFVSGQVKENTKDSVILNLTITKKGTGAVTIDSATYTPIYTYRSGAAVNQFEVLDIKKALDAYDAGNGYISDNDYNVLSREYEKIVSTVGEEW